MGQLPQHPLNYTGSDPTPSPKFRRGVLGWVLFIGLAIMLFMLLSKREGNHRLITLSDFVERLEAKRIASVTLDADELYGSTVDGQPFRTPLPPGMGSNWDFVRWLLENSRGTATVEIRNANNVLVNILLPLIPWLLIFGFIWFFVFRQLRKTSCIKTAQAVATGPGRWVPDEPGKAGQA